jgi:hypothetical protein
MYNFFLYELLVGIIFLTGLYTQYLQPYPVLFFCFIHIHAQIKYFFIRFYPYLCVYCMRRKSAIVLFDIESCLIVLIFSGFFIC